MLFFLSSLCKDSSQIVGRVISANVFDILKLVFIWVGKLPTGWKLVSLAETGLKNIYITEFYYRIKVKLSQFLDIEFGFYI